MHCLLECQSLYQLICPFEFHPVLVSIYLLRGSVKVVRADSHEVKIAQGDILDLVALPECLLGEYMGKVKPSVLQILLFVIYELHLFSVLLDGLNQLVGAIFLSLYFHNVLDCMLGVVILLYVGVHLRSLSLLVALDDLIFP